MRHVISERDILFTAPTERAVPQSFRADIEGLRALAVVLVVLEHTFGQPLSGFIGVDVFFVISGFLITGLLLKEWRTTERISLTAFYARRARRILPVAAVALIVTVTAAFFIWNLPRAFATALDGIAGGFFVQNWHLIAVGTDYLSSDGGTSPLQHFWSLAVEEQFYIFWPVLIVVIGVITARHRAPHRFTALFLLATAVVVIASIVYAVWRLDTAPTAAYFDSFTRFWELGVGAALSVATPWLTRVPLWFRRGAVVYGLAVIVASAFVLGPDVSFPWPAAVLPVLGTILVIGFGGHGTERAGLLLTNSVSRWLGRHSYSLYLWHFPVIVFAVSLGFDSPLAGAVIVVISVVLAWLSYRFIEVPTRHSGWLRRWERPAPARRGRRSRRWTTQQLVLGSTVALVVGVSVVGQLRGPAVLVDPSALASQTGIAGTDQVDAAAAEQALTGAEDGSLPDAIKAAADATAWPQLLTPSLDQAFASQMAPAMGAGGCRFDVDAIGQVAPCSIGDVDADRVALVIGDSIALSWTPAVIEALVPLGWRVEALGFASCPAVDVDVTLGSAADGFAAACAERRAELSDLVAARSPDLLILSSSQRGFDALVSGANGAAAAEEWTKGTASTLSALSQHAARTVILSNPPRVKSPSVCANRFSEAQACATELDDTYEAKNGAEQDAVDRAAAHGVDAAYVDTRDWFCTDDGRCPAAIGDVLLRVDQWHLTETAALAYASRMRDALEVLG